MSVENKIDWDDTEFDTGPVSEKIIARIKQDGARYWAGDNISKYIGAEDKEPLIDEITEKFEGVLDSLIID